MSPISSKDLLFCIFSFLDSRDLSCVSRVNRVFHEAANAQLLWKQLCQQKDLDRFADLSKEVDWKVLYLTNTAEKIRRANAYAYSSSNSEWLLAEHHYPTKILSSRALCPHFEHQILEIHDVRPTSKKSWVFECSMSLSIKNSFFAIDQNKIVHIWDMGNCQELGQHADVQNFCFDSWRQHAFLGSPKHVMLGL